MKWDKTINHILIYKIKYISYPLHPERKNKKNSCFVVSVCELVLVHLSKGGMGKLWTLLELIFVINKYIFGFVLIQGLAFL